MSRIKLLVGVLGAATCLAQAHAAVVFQDGFDGNSLANWSFSGQNMATWDAASQKLQSTTVSNTAHNPTSPGFAAINGLTTSSHFKIEADVQVVGPVPGRTDPNDFGHVGFFWGHQSDAAYSIGYLRTHSDHVTAWESPYTAELLTPAGFTTTNAADINGVDYHLSFEVDYLAEVLRVGIGGTTQVFSGADFHKANSPGGVGGTLGVISWGERVSYDNVKVTDFAVASVPEPGTLALLMPALGLLGFLGRRRAA